MLKEVMRFSREHPINTIVFGLASAFAAQGIYYAATTGKGEFQDKQYAPLPPFGAMGATTSTSTTTSSSHPMNRAPAGDMMKHPTSLFGYKNMGSHCTGGVSGACSNPHCHCGGAGLGAGHKGRMKTMYGHEGSDYGEDVAEAPLFGGVPSSVKRRVMINSVGDDDIPYHRARKDAMFGHQQEDPSVEAIMGFSGMVDQGSGSGWW